MRFFGGLVNRRYLNSVHSKLDEMEAVGAAQNDSDQLVSRRRELFKAMSKWLVDTSVVQDKRLLTSSLSPVYFPKKLAKLIQGDHVIILMRRRLSTHGSKEFTVQYLAGVVDGIP